MLITSTVIKLDEEGFNNLPPRKKLLEYLKNIPSLVIVDTDRQYWLNDYDTLVFCIDITKFEKLSGEAVNNLMETIFLFTKHTRPDEIDSQRVGCVVVYRLWWD